MSDASLRLEKLNAAKELKTAQELKRRSHNKGRLTDAELAALKPQTSAQLHAEIKEMGTITVRTNQSGLNGKQIYYMYKQRQAIEQYFKTYGDTMEFESSYMRGRNEEEAWLFLNHLSSVFAIGCIEEIAGKGIQTCFPHGGKVRMPDMGGLVIQIAPCQRQPFVIVVHR